MPTTDQAHIKAMAMHVIGLNLDNDGVVAIRLLDLHYRPDDIFPCLSEIIERAREIVVASRRH